MAQLSFDSPLKWPSSYAITPRMRQRSDSGFSSSMTLEEALQFLNEEITAFDPQAALLSTDIENIHNPRNRHPLGTRSGVCLHMKLGNRSYIFACDRWQKLEHNLYVLHLTLRQLRNMDKWGIASLEEMLKPFEAGGREKFLAREESASEPGSEWMHVMGLGPTATLEDAVAIYHRRAKRIGNTDSEALSQLNAAMNEARQALKTEES